jgi:hypothetical protein
MPPLVNTLLEHITKGTERILFPQEKEMKIILGEVLKVLKEKNIPKTDQENVKN